MKRFLGKNFYSLTSIFLLGGGMVACAPLTGGTDSSTAGCITNQEDDSGAQVGLNEPGITTPSGIVSGAGLAQAFYTSFSVTAPEVAIKLDLVAPSGTTFTGNVNLEIVADSSSTISGTPVPTSPNSAPITTGAIIASSTVLASSIIAPQGAALFYDFCFDGAVGLNCGSSTGSATATTGVTGVTLNSNSIYWVVVTAGYTGTSSQYIEWRAGNDSITGGLAAIFGNAWTALVTSPTLKTFDFKIGC